MNKRLQIAVLGNGFMGKKHIETIQSIEEIYLSAIIDQNSKPNGEDSCSYYESIEEFIDKDLLSTDIVTISTPNYLHFSQAKKLLESGYHVIIEKPFCMTGIEAKKLSEISKNNGKQVFTIMQNRNSSISKWLKELVSSDILGDIYYVQTNCFWNRNENYYLPKSWKGTKKFDGGTLYTQFTHFVDLILWIFGDVSTIKSNLKTFRHNDIIEIEDTGIVTFNFNNGGLGSLNFSTAIYGGNFETSMTILAQNGTVKISGQYFDCVEYCNIKDYTFDPNAIEAPNNLENLKQDYLSFLNLLNSEQNSRCLQESEKYISFIENVYRNN